MNEINWEQEARLKVAQEERQRKLARGWVEPEDPGNTPPPAMTLQDYAESATDYISRGIINALSADLGGENNLLDILPVQPLRSNGRPLVDNPYLEAALRPVGVHPRDYERGTYRDDATDAVRAAVPYLRSEQPIIRHYRVPQLTGPDLDILVEVRENESRVVLNRENRRHLGHVIAALGLVGRAAEDTRRLLEGVINQCGPDSAVVRANDGTFYVQPTRVPASYEQLGSMGLPPEYLQGNPPSSSTQARSAFERAEADAVRAQQTIAARRINRLMNSYLIDGNEDATAMLRGIGGL